jgi:HSP20 family protein
MSPVTPSCATTARSAVERSAWMPPVDIVEDAAGITLYADLPGVGKDQLHLRVEGEQLGIEAEALWPGSDGATPLRNEWPRQLYRRSFTLGKELDAEGITAELTHGALRVRIPKTAHAPSRRINVVV